MTKVKKVLIITYSYSSLDGVGSRRWIKYSHELAKKGHQVFVLCEASRMNSKEQHLDVIYTTFKSKYPKVLQEPTDTFLKKIVYRFHLMKNKLFVKGSPFDKAALDRVNIISEAEKIIIANSIENLIVSGAPFSLLGYGVVIKTKFPRLNFIADLRDPWSLGHIYGMASLIDVRKEFEQNSERRAIKTSDHFLVATKDMKIELDDMYPSSKGKIQVLMNGIENNEIKTTKKVESQKLIISHIGSINMGTEKYWKRIFTILSTVDLPIEIRLIGLRNPKVAEFVKRLKSNRFNLIERVEESQLHELISMSDVFLMFKKDGFENSFPSKYFDYIKNKKPILGFTNQGAVQFEIEENKIGFIYNEKFSDDEIREILSQIHLGIYIYNKNYDWTEFTIEKLTNQIENRLI